MGTRQGRRGNEGATRIAYRVDGVGSSRRRRDVTDLAAGFGAEIPGHAAHRGQRLVQRARPHLVPARRGGPVHAHGVRDADRLRRAPEQVRAAARQVVDARRSAHHRFRPARRRRLPQRQQVRRRRRGLHVQLPDRPQRAHAVQGALRLDGERREARTVQNSGGLQEGVRDRHAAARLSPLPLQFQDPSRAGEEGRLWPRRAVGDRALQGRVDGREPGARDGAVRPLLRQVRELPGTGQARDRHPDARSPDPDRPVHDRRRGFAAQRAGRCRARAGQGAERPGHLHPCRHAALSHARTRSAGPATSR